MSKPKLYDVVRLREPIPDCGLTAGETGAIVLAYERPDEAYEVEFTDDQGRTRALCSLLPHQFDIVWSVAPTSDEVRETPVPAT